MNCYLCDQKLRYVPSWRGIFLNEPQPVTCAACNNRFSKTGEPCCTICGKDGNGFCRDCLYWEANGYGGMIQSGRSLYRYNEAMKEWLHQYKFLKDVVLAEVFARDLKEALAGEQSVIVPVPLHPEKLHERSFSQVDQLLISAGLPYKQLLEKCGGTLGEKNRLERIAVDNLFRLNGEPVPKQVILVDDLYTTGTTMRQAARTLLEGGAETISILALIRA